jgi:hypothetical protein
VQHRRSAARQARASGLGAARGQTHGQPTGPKSFDYFRANEYSPLEPLNRRARLVRARWRPRAAPDRLWRGTAELSPRTFCTFLRDHRDGRSQPRPSAFGVSGTDTGRDVLWYRGRRADRPDDTRVGHAVKPTDRHRARPARQSTRPRDPGVLTAFRPPESRGPPRLEATASEEADRAVARIGVRNRVRAHSVVLPSPPLASE